MSAFLGPIHYRMFEKARSVDGLARRIAAYADAQGWTEGHAVALDASNPRLEGEITDHIDLSQIHASLDALVHDSEAALAAACAPLADHIDEVCAYARTLGAQAAESDGATADADVKQIWQLVDGHWLDGMPCDGFVTVTGGEPDAVSWTINLAPHTAAGYERLRTAWTAGYLDAVDVQLESFGNGAYRMAKAA
jgi:hypothetical protein